MFVYVDWWLTFRIFGFDHTQSKFPLRCVEHSPQISAFQSGTLGGISTEIWESTNMIIRNQNMYFCCTKLSFIQRLSLYEVLNTVISGVYPLNLIIHAGRMVKDVATWQTKEGEVILPRVTASFSDIHWILSPQFFWPASHILLPGPSHLQDTLHGAASGLPHRHTSPR